MKDTTYGIGEMLYQLLTKHKMQHQCVASCWNDVQVEEIITHLDITPAQFLTSSLREWRRDPVGFFNKKVSQGVQSFSVAASEVNADFLRQAHLRLMPVFVWTVNSEKDMKRYYEIGVDGIISNNVQEVVDVGRISCTHGTIRPYHLDSHEDSFSEKYYSQQDIIFLTMGIIGSVFVLNVLLLVLVPLLKRKFCPLTYVEMTGASNNLKTIPV